MLRLFCGSDTVLRRIGFPLQQGESHDSAPDAVARAPRPSKVGGQFSPNLLTQSHGCVQSGLVPTTPGADTKRYGMRTMFYRSDILRLKTVLFGLLTALFSVLIVSCSSEGGNEDATVVDSVGEIEEVDETTAPEVDTGTVECVPGTARCVADTTTEICSQDSEWEITECETNQLCWGGECGDVGTCEPSSVQECVGFDRYAGCNPIGTGYGEFQVDFNLTCIDDELIPRVCLAGETQCQDEQVLLVCDESGLDYEHSTNCLQDDETTLCDDGACISLCQFIAKSESYVGCEYWAVDLDNAFLTNGAGIPLDAYFAPFAVAVSNPGGTLAAEVTIRSVSEEFVPGPNSLPNVVEPGEMVVFNLPPSSIEGTMHGFEAYQITSTVPIVAYQFNPLDDEQVYSNDASLLLPTTSLGTRYYGMTRRQTFEQLKGSMTVVATQPGETEITTFRLPETTDQNPMRTLAGTDIPPMEGGDEFSITLQQFEVLNIETNYLGADLTGTYIESTRPVAVFGGTEASNAPNTDSCIYRETIPDGEVWTEEERWVCEWDRETKCWDSNRNEPSIGRCTEFITCCADHLEQQMLPIFAWGREFNAVHSAFRGSEADVWRVLASEDDTHVTLVGIPTIEADCDPERPPEECPPPRPALGEPGQNNYTVDEGEWFEFESRADFEVLADNPVFIGQFLAAEFSPTPESRNNSPEFPTDAGTGDPAFITVVPREQYREDYIFLVPGQYESSWASIVAPVGVSVEHTDTSGVVTLEADSFEPFAGGEWAALRIQLVNEGYHRLTAEESFGAMVHGYDQFVSYGYPAGLDVKKINRRREN